MRWLDLTLDLFLPDVCAACGRPPARSLAFPLCEHCTAALWRLPRPLVGRQGQRTAWCLGTYRGPLGRCLLRGKTGAHPHLLRSIGHWTGERVHRRMPRVDALVPVPSSRRRGVDATQVLAEGMSRPLKVPVRRLLHRVQWTGQRGQSVHGRRLQASRAYRAPATPRDGGALPRRVLLLDDVHTTGATLDACTQELLGAGVGAVHVVAVVAARRTQGLQSSLSVPGEP